MSDAWKAEFVHRARFNLEANSRMYGVLSGITSRALERDRGSWFSSLMGILNHIIVVDIRWLDRFRPLSPDAPALSDGRLAGFPLEWKPLRDDFSPLREDRSVIDSIILNWFEQYPADGLMTKFTYVDSGGTAHDTFAARAFEYLLLHQNYHRGQISQILDELGVPHSFADNVDFIGQH